MDQYASLLGLLAEQVRPGAWWAEEWVCTVIDTRCSITTYHSHERHMYIVEVYATLPDGILYSAQSSISEMDLVAYKPMVVASMLKQVVRGAYAALGNDLMNIFGSDPPWDHK